MVVRKETDGNRSPRRTVQRGEKTLLIQHSNASRRNLRYSRQMKRRRLRTNREKVNRGWEADVPGQSMNDTGTTAHATAKTRKSQPSKIIRTFYNCHLASRLPVNVLPSGGYPLPPSTSGGMFFRKINHAETHCGSATGNYRRFESSFALLAG
jgi:hypothetical protein